MSVGQDNVFSKIASSEHLPKHIAIIMDGNGRWAQERGKPRWHGHEKGAKTLKEILDGCLKLGIPYLTVYAFSKENWNRPSSEVNALMDLLSDCMDKYLKVFIEKGIKVCVVGDIGELPSKCKKKIQEAVFRTERLDKLQLTVALSYSSRWEIVEATKMICKKVLEKKVELQDIDCKLFGDCLQTKTPDPALLIRTGGEMRVSNFLLWQIAYTELFVTNTYWPDFKQGAFYEAILEYLARERRFGKIN